MPTSNSYYLALDELPINTRKKHSDVAEDVDATVPTDDGNGNDTAEALCNATEPAPASIDTPANGTEVDAAASTPGDIDLYITDHYMLTEQKDIADASVHSPQMPIPDAVQPGTDRSDDDPPIFPTPTELPKPDTAPTERPPKTGFWASLRRKRK